MCHKLGLMLDPRRLLSFRSAAQLGSFTRAAGALSLTQSAVSQQVADLERQVGIQLLTRGRRGVTPTDAGALLLRHADAIAARLELAEHQLADHTHRLRIGAFPSALADMVPIAIGAVRHAEPRAQIEAVEAPIARLHDLVRHGTLQLAICFSELDTTLADDGVLRHELFVESMLVALAPNHPLAAREAIALTSLADEDWLSPTPDHLIVGVCRAAGFEPRLAFLTADPAAIRALCAQGLAVTLVPQLLSKHMHDVALRPVLPDPPLRRVYAATTAVPDRLTRIALDSLKAQTPA